MDVVSIASFLLPTLLSMMLGKGKERLGFPEISPRRKMIHLSTDIYKMLTPVQKQKLIDMDVLQPDFESLLLDIFNRYLAEPYDPICSRYKGLLLMIKPEELAGKRNRFNAFKSRVLDLMLKYFPDVRISSISSRHPNYSSLYEYWRKIHKIFPSPKK
jgi:hypothetical protein